MRSVLLCLAGLVLAACDGASPTGLVGREPSKPAFATVELFADCPDSVAAVDIPAAVRDSIQAGIASNYFDGRLAIVARRVPGGFAGEWTGADGRFTVGLVDLTQRDAALAALHDDPLLPRQVPLDAAVVQTRWNFAQLVEWDRYLTPALGREPDLVGIDRDELANRLVYGVRTVAGRDRVISALRAAGAPCGLIQIRAQEPPVPAERTPARFDGAGRR
jgi:hypothetical protein